MESLPFIGTETTTSTTDASNIQQYLQRIAPTHRRLIWKLLRKELEAFPQEEEIHSLPVRKFSRILFNTLINRQVRTHTILRNLFVRLLSAFLASDTFTCVCDRFERTAEEGRRQFQASHLCLWLALWSIRRYPQLSRLLLNPQVEQRYSGLCEISLGQFITYSPRFVLCRLENHIRSPRNVIWIRWMAQGKNIRKAPLLPFPLTKRMAHWLTLAPDSATFYEAMLYGRIRAAGGSDALFQELRGRFGNGVQHSHDDIICFLVRHETSLGTAVRSQLIGYLEHRRMEESNFRLKGRTLPGLVRAMREWYEEQETIQIDNPRYWFGADYNYFHQERGKYTFQIIQLTSSWELAQEGATLKHCVGSYAYACQVGRCSIWSLRRQHRENGQTVTTHLVTIEVDANKKIVQARSRYNALPKPEEENMIRRWARTEELSVERF